METAAAIILGALAGAVAFRIRGGALTDRWHNFSGQGARLIYAAIMALITVLAGDVVRWGVVPLTAAWFIGAVVLGTLGSIDAGRNPDVGDGPHPQLRDFGMNCARGALYAAPAALALIGLRVWTGGNAETAPFLVLFGLAMGPCYELAWRFWPMDRGGKPTVAAELAFGAFLGAGAALV